MVKRSVHDRSKTRGDFTATISFLFPFLPVPVLDDHPLYNFALPNVITLTTIRPCSNWIEGKKDIHPSVARRSTFPFTSGENEQLCLYIYIQRAEIAIGSNILIIPSRSQFLSIFIDYFCAECDKETAFTVRVPKIPANDFRCPLSLPLGRRPFEYAFSQQKKKETKTPQLRDRGYQPG